MLSTKLTPDDIPPGWHIMKVKDVIESIFSGPSPDCEERQVKSKKEWGVLKTTAITWEHGWDFRNHKVLPFNFWGLTHLQVREGDTIITKAGPRHRCGVVVYVTTVPSQIIVSGKMINLRPNRKKVIPTFLSLALSTFSAQKFLDARTTGMAESQVNFTNETLMETPISIPPLNEQHRISEIFSIINETMEQNKALIEKYSNIKKGLMADLLTRGIDMEGRIRNEETHGFRDSILGRIPEEWKVETLETVCAKAINGGTPSTEIEKYWKGNIPWITGADIISQKVSKIRRYINEDAVRNSSTNVILKGNLLVVTRTGVGKLAIAPFDIAVSQDFTGLIPNEKVITEFLFWLLDKFMNYFLNLIQGTSINGITRKDLMSFRFSCPPIHEQRRICEILTTTDKQIEIEESYLDKLQQIKKGLMQDLLTGRLRVKIPQEAEA